MADGYVANDSTPEMPSHPIAKVGPWIRNLFTLRYGMVWVLIALVIVASVIQDSFLQWGNIRNMLHQNAPVGIVAVGMTYVMIARGFDLSVGSIYGGAATFYASLAGKVSILVAAPATILVGCVAGAINGLVVTRLKVNPFIATFGTASVFMGATFLYANSKTFPFREESFRTLGSDRIFDVPWSVIVLVAIFVVGGVILSKTVYGRSLYAIGGNDEAARLSGLRVDVLRASTFVLAGACAALAGMLIASRIGVGQPDMTRGTLALDSIAIVVIGGTSLFGGEGAVWRTAVGLLILAVLSNLFDSYAVQSSTQEIIKGSIVVGAVGLDAMARSRRQ